MAAILLRSPYYETHSQAYVNPDVAKSATIVLLVNGTQITSMSKDTVPFELFINWSSPLVLVEGMFDALAVKRNAIPLLGKHIQRELMKKIVTSQVQKIYIALDKDAQQDAVKFCEQLMDEGKEIYLVDLEDKDPSEMGFKAITNLIQKTTPLDQYGLMAKKLQFV